MVRTEFIKEGFGTVGRLGFEEVWVPPPIDMTPQTVGWWVLAVVVIATLIYAAYRGVGRYRADAYRRHALKALREIRVSVSMEPQRAVELPTLLKRTALDGFPRSRAAALSGKPWGEFLMATAPGSFDDTTVALLFRLAYRGVSQLESSDITALIDAIEQWIRRHRAAV